MRSWGGSSSLAERYALRPAIRLAIRVTIRSNPNSCAKAWAVIRLAGSRFEIEARLE